MKKIQGSILSLGLLCSSLAISMEPEEKKQISSIGSQAKAALKSANVYIDLKTLFTRVIDITAKLIDDEEVTARHIAPLADCLRDNRLEELERNGFINRERLIALQTKARSGAKIEKSDILQAVKINKLIELFGYNTQDLSKYINPEGITTIVWDHYLKEGTLKKEVMQTLLQENAVNVENVPELFEHNPKDETLLNYFNMGKVLKLIALGYCDGTITREEVVKAIKVPAFIKFLGIDPETFTTYIDQEKFALSCLSLTGAYFEDQLNRRKVLIALQKSLKGQVAELAGVNRGFMQKYLNCNEFGCILGELLEGQKISRQRLLGIFNMRELQKIGITQESLEQYIDLNDLAHLLNELPTDAEINRDRLKRPFKIKNIERRLYLPSGTLDGLLDPRVPAPIQERNLEVIQKRISPDRFLETKKYFAKGTPVTLGIWLSLWCAGHLISYPVNALNSLAGREHINPSSFGAGILCALITYIIAYTLHQVYFAEPTMPSRVITFNTLWPAFIQGFWGVDVYTPSLELLDPRHPLYTSFSAFAAPLRQEQIDLLNPTYTLGLAADNPNLLLDQNAFMQSLSELQTQHLSTLCEQHRAYKKLDARDPNFLSFCQFLCTLDAEQIHEIFDSTSFKIKGEDKPTYNPWRDIQQHPEWLLEDPRLQARLGVEQRNVLSALIAKSTLLAMLDDTHISFVSYALFIHSLTQAQLNHLSPEQWRDGQKNPLTLMQFDHLTQSLTQEQKDKLQELIREYQA